MMLNYNLRCWAILICSMVGVFAVGFILAMVMIEIVTKDTQKTESVVIEEDTRPEPTEKPEK